MSRTKSNLRRRSWPFGVVVAGILTLATTVPGLGQTTYQQPPAPIPSIVDAPRPPRLMASPDGTEFLMVESHAMPSIEDLSRPMLRLAGLRIDPLSNGRFSTRFDRAITLRREDGSTAPVALPENARIGGVSWSPDGRHFAFTNVTDVGTQLWVASVDDLKPRQAVDRLSTIFGGYEWLSDGSSLLCRVVPVDRGDEPKPPRRPAGPNVQTTSGEKTPLRTYQDLLRNAHDEALFEHYAACRLARVSVRPDEIHVDYLGEPAIYTSVSASPDAQYLLVQRLERPFSFVMPYYHFPRRVEIWDREGKVVREFARKPLAANIPIGGVETGPRSVSWIPWDDARLVWVEALDGGDPKATVAHRDEWRTLPAPFAGNGKPLVQTEHRARGISFLDSSRQFIASEYDRDRRWTRSLFHDLDHADAQPTVLEDRSVRDRYADPGRPITDRHHRAPSYVVRDGDWIFRAGSGVGPDGTFPFLRKQNVRTGETETLWQCASGEYETVQSARVQKDGTIVFLTRHENPTSPPNYRRRWVGNQEFAALTEFDDPTPQIRDVQKEVVRYAREDGVPLSATLYTPAGYDAKRDGPLPMLVWAYPREFNDAKTAGQISANPWRFTRIGGSSHLHLVTQGYVIMDGATMPIIGDAETMNDSFLDQLVASAKAAIDEGVRRGVADRKRVAIGGHSYGAFMTANLLAHCDLFAAGIARSGAYNRTLTPFGFQSERRTLWESPETYFQISPFMHAHKIEEPILMIHGEVDNNSGTFPLQSRRLFQAIQGNGGTARLVMLPHESHGYRARESVLHTLAEMHGWLESHVRANGIVPAKFKD